ncbi:MAG: hypothetical protein CME06_09355 [Gemmatimonadetes bacterium]|nr:hypothetical protein [Gemmatimonadota bacterium]
MIHETCFATVALVASSIAAPGSIAGQAAIGRPEEPIEMEGSRVPNLIGTGVDEFALYAWDGSQFQPVNFQVDERGSGGAYFSEDAITGFIDDNDQIVFMLEDVGDSVGTDEWLDHPNVDPENRYEIELTDPLNPDQKGWVYLFLGEDLPLSGEDYVDVLVDDPFHVASDRYGEEYLPGIPGAMDDLYLLPGMDGTGVDLYDRMKFRVKLGPLVDWQTEEDGIAENRNYKDGTVRVVHAYNVTMPVIGFAISNTQVIYHRQMSITRNKIFQLWAPDAKRMLWLTDLHPGMSDFVYYDNRGGDPESAATFADTIDGDGLRATGDLSTFQELVSPTQGASLSVQDNRVIPADEALSYYCDACEDVEAWPETGDGTKWGENGTWLKRIEFTTEPFELESWNWRLPPYSDGSHGQEFARRYFNRVTIAADWQYPDGIEDAGDRAPGTARVRIDQNAPNPFNPRTKIDFYISGGAGRVRLDVYDLAGRRVRVLVDASLSPGDHAVVWDGDDDAGRAQPSGVYTCRIAAGEDHESRRMLLLK